MYWLVWLLMFISNHFAPSEVGGTSLRERVTNSGRALRRATATMAQIQDGNLTLLTEFLGRTESQDNERPEEGQKVAIIIHATATKRGVTARALNIRHLLRRIVESSWNYIIDVDGSVWWYVNELLRNAWHAGKSFIPSGRFRGRLSGWVRRHTVGIEIVNPNDGSRLTDAQLVSLIKVVRRIMRELNIERLVEGENIFMHFDIAPGRKFDAKCITLAQIIALIHAAPEPAPGPRRGTWFVKAKPSARVRGGRNTGTAHVSSRLFGEPVTVLDWKNDGQDVDENGNTWWALIAPTRTSKGGWVYGGLLSDSPVHKTVIGIIKRQTFVMARALADRISPIDTSEDSMDLVTCGPGMVQDGDEADLLAEAGITLSRRKRSVAS